MSDKTDKDQANLSGLPKKWDNILKKMPEFKEKADASSVEDLKKIIIEAEGNLYTIAKEEEADVKLQSAKEMVKTLSEPHKDGKRFEGCKVQYALLLLEGQGVDLDGIERN